MRRIVFALLGTAGGVLLLFSYHTSTSSTLARTTPGAGGGTGADGTGTDAGGSTDDASGGTTYTGDSAQTQWGIVQVEITVTGGKITKSVAVQYPQGNGRDQQINAFALPILAKEVVAAQAGTIDAVSGATVTSDGYIQSLQSAIDQAHL